MSPEIAALLRAAKVPLVTHMPVVLFGTNYKGEAYQRRGLVLAPWQKFEGAWLIDDGQPGPARVRRQDEWWMQAGVIGYAKSKPGLLPGHIYGWEPWHFEPLPDPETRVGFLLLCDEAWRRKIHAVSWPTTGERWVPLPRLYEFPTLPYFIDGLCRVLAESTPVPPSPPSPP